ncbi:MAG TPA: peptidyl-prolyl cis-trans isomerase [Terriglobales bacterium]|nr:peptidyl-prolyl cis-trans isomerase [Terriglobales bacterium]
MMQYAFVCLLLAAMAWGQAASPPPPPAQQPGSQPGAPPSAPGNPPAGKEDQAAKVAPDAAVITIAGLCDHPPADKATADPNCKTVITRAEFERIMDAVQPNMPPPRRRQFAMRYSMALVMTEKAHEMGLDQGPKFEDRMKLMRVQVLSQEYNQAQQEKAAQVSDQDIADYYKSHAPDYEEANLQRIFVPRAQQPPASKVKLSAAAEEKRRKDSEQIMQKEADKLHARAVAGEDFSKLQAEAFQTAGMKTKPPSTKMGEIRRSGLPPAQATVMDLKTGEISAVISDASGFYIFKVGAKEEAPLDKVKEEIRGALRSQHMQEQMQAMQQSATPTLDESYFGPEMPPPHGMPLPPPTGGPSPKPPAPGPQ